MNSLTIQYIILAALVVVACYSIFNLIRKNFAQKKFSSKHTGCDKDCGCS